MKASFIKKQVTIPAYDTFLDKHVYMGEDPFKLPANDDWDPKTGSCAFHGLFTIEALGGKLTKGLMSYKGHKEVKETTIERLLEKLDSGSILEFVYEYRDRSLANTVPVNEFAETHDFVIVKGDDKYFVSQGFQFVYKHSLRSHTKEYIRTMLHNILKHLCDPDNTKKWKDMDISYYKKYFYADLTTGKMAQLPINPNKKVHGYILRYAEVIPQAKEKN